MSQREVRIVFMGTPAFAVPSLRALLQLGEDGVPAARLVGVFTQPDRPAGRGQRLTPPPVKEAALAAGIPVFQPERLPRAEALSLLESVSPDLIVVAAYARILSPRVLDLPRFGCLNVHASLLPLYRGASPISAAILDGVKNTGVSIMRMEAGLDTGPVLAQASLPIGDDDTTGSLTEKLALLGARELAVIIQPWIAGSIEPRPQNEAVATVTRPLRKEDGRIHWGQPAQAIARQVRAMFPWPGTSTLSEGVILKVLAADVAPCPEPASMAPVGAVAQRHGEPLVATGDGTLRLARVQPAGRKAMSGAEWLRGSPAALGGILGEPG
ncbi:MAG TPA: methionyl-tRNA formyltransferase [Chloroflexota bacterium]|nr:methionyl-tRNA formyltransferase [Chloroflexota bacterium]